MMGLMKHVIRLNEVDGKDGKKKEKKRIKMKILKDDMIGISEHER